MCGYVCVHVGVGGCAYLHFVRVAHACAVQLAERERHARRQAVHLRECL
jgi:hypothetical protein